MEYLKIKLCSQTSKNKIQKKLEKFPRSLYRLIDGQRTERSDLCYKEKILESSQRKLEPKNKEFDCKKIKACWRRKNDLPTQFKDFAHS